MAKPAKGFEHLDVYHLAEEIADIIWGIVRHWDSLSRDTVGKQLICAADSVGANIAEGTGRGTFKDNCHFARIARGSFYESRHFLRRAFQRKLMTVDQIDRLQPLVAELGPRLNAYIRSIAKKSEGQSKSNGPSNK